MPESWHVLGEQTGQNGQGTKYFVRNERRQTASGETGHLGIHGGEQPAVRGPHRLKKQPRSRDTPSIQAQAPNRDTSTRCHARTPAGQAPQRSRRQTTALFGGRLDVATHRDTPRRTAHRRGRKVRAAARADRREVDDDRFRMTSSSSVASTRHVSNRLG